MALAEPPRTDGPTGRCHPDDRGAASLRREER